MKAKFMVAASVAVLAVCCAVYWAVRSGHGGNRGGGVVSHKTHKTGDRQEAPATLGRGDARAAADQGSEAALPEAAGVDPKIVLLPEKTYPSIPTIPTGKLTEEDREAARKILRDINQYVTSIDKMEFDLVITDSLFPSGEMTGHLSSSKMDSWVFDGRILGNSVGARITFGDKKGQVLIANPDGKESQGNIPQDMAAQLNESFWLQGPRNEKVADVIEEIAFNQEVQIDDQTKAACTVMKGMGCTVAFEASTGRLLRSDKQDKMGHMTYIFGYDGDGKYPTKITSLCPEKNWKKVEEHKNLKITYKQ